MSHLILPTLTTFRSEPLIVGHARYTPVSYCVLPSTEACDERIRPSAILRISWMLASSLMPNWRQSCMQICASENTLPQVSLFLHLFSSVLIASSRIANVKWLAFIISKTMCTRHLTSVPHSAGVTSGFFLGDGVRHLL